MTPVDVGPDAGQDDADESHELDGVKAGRHFDRFRLLGRPGLGRHGFGWG